MKKNGRWYVTKHAIEQYMARVNGTSETYALSQIKALMELAEHRDTKPTGVERYRIADLTFVVKDDHCVMTVY